MHRRAISVQCNQRFNAFSYIGVVFSCGVSAASHSVFSFSAGDTRGAAKETTHVAMLSVFYAGVFFCLRYELNRVSSSRPAKHTRGRQRNNIHLNS